MTINSQQFVETYRAYLPMISKFFAYRVESNDIEDLASEVFSIAWQKREAAPNEHLAAWLYRIAANVLANHRRKSLFRITFPLMENDILEPSAEQLALANVSVRSAWANLGKSDRVIISLVSLEGFSLEEAAQILKTTKNAVTIRFHRARKRFETLLKESEG